MIIRALIRLVTLAALAVAGWWIGRLFTGRQRRRAHDPNAVRSRSGGTMVRDRVCNTFLPRASAIETRVGDETHFFCSEACRRRFLRGSETAQSA